MEKLYNINNAKNQNLKKRKATVVNLGNDILEKTEKQGVSVPRETH